MESTLKILVGLAVAAAILWVISPIISGAISVGEQKKLDLSIVGQSYSLTPLGLECIDLCEVSVAGSLYNLGASAKNILLSASFYNDRQKNVGGFNLPLIDSLGEGQTREFASSFNYSCNVTSVSVSIIRSEKA
jgi:hypothetical protein